MNSTLIVGGVVIAIIGLLFGLVVIVGVVAAFKGSAKAREEKERLGREKKEREEKERLRRELEQLRNAPASVVIPTTLDDQADAWLTGLKRVAERKAATIISGRYADHEAEQITSAFTHGVQPRPLAQPAPAPVIQTQYPWNIGNPHPVAQHATQGTSMPLNPFVQAPASAP